jgi:hypothetical protein
MNKKKRFLDAFNEAIDCTDPEERSLHQKVKRRRRILAEQNLDHRLKNITSVIITTETCPCRCDVDHYLLKITGVGFEDEMCPISFFTGLERIRLRESKEHGYKFESLFRSVSGSVFK